MKFSTMSFCTAAIVAAFVCILTNHLILASFFVVVALGLKDLPPEVEVPNDE